MDLTSGATGAASGFATGSAFGPVGGAIGAVGGGLLGLFGRSKKQKTAKPRKIGTMNPMQQKMFNNYAKGINGKGKYADLFNFDAAKARDNFNANFSQPAYQSFKENVIPGITGAFRGQNLQNSSYLGGALSKAGTDVQRNLDTQLANMLYQGQNDSVNRRIDALNNILNTQTFAYQQPQQQQQSSGDQAFGMLTDIGGKALGGYLDKKFGSN